MVTNTFNGTTAVMRDASLKPQDRHLALRALPAILPREASGKIKKSMGSHLSRQTASTSARIGLHATHNSLSWPAPRPSSSRPPRYIASTRWTRADWVYLALGCILTFVLAATMGHKRIFWEDELLGWLMLRDPSWKHLLDGWLHGVDGGGILFYITGRLWFRIFGPSVVSFRMYTATGFAITLSAVWAIGRRFYPPAVVALAVLVTWFASPVLVQALGEGRFYGLLMASDAIAVYLYFHLANRDKVPWRFCALVFAAHACLVLSHILGVVYSSLIVLAMILLDVTRRRWRLRLYAAAALPALLLIPCLPAISASARVGKPHFWSAQPSFIMFLADYAGFSLKLLVLLLVWIAIVLVRARRRGLRDTIAAAFAERSPVYIYSAAIFLLPLLLLLEGIAGPALCTPRYLLPVAVGTIFLVAESFLLAGPMLPRDGRRNFAIRAALWTAFLAVVLLYDFVYLPRYNSGLQKDYTGALTAQLPKGIPVVCEDAFAFTELVALQHSSGVQYTFLLDWKNAIAPKAPRVEVTQYHLMQNWKNHGFFAGSIEYRDTFLRLTPSFYSISFTDFVQANPLRPPSKVERYPGIGNPIHDELAAESLYKVSLYKVVHIGELNANIWRICRTDALHCP